MLHAVNRLFKEYNVIGKIQISQFSFIHPTYTCVTVFHNSAHHPVDGNCKQTTMVVGCSLGGHLLSLGTIHLYRRLFWLHCNSLCTDSASGLSLLFSLAAHTIRRFFTMLVYWCCQTLCESQHVYYNWFLTFWHYLWSAGEWRVWSIPDRPGLTPACCWAGVIAGQMYFVYGSAILLQMLCLGRTRALSLANY